MMQVRFGGSWYSSMNAAARAWAATALPDVSALEPGAKPAEFAEDLEAFWWGEAQKIGEGAPEDLGEHEWRGACRAALLERIETAIREDRRAVSAMRRAS